MNAILVFTIFTFIFFRSFIFYSLFLRSFRFICFMFGFTAFTNLICYICQLLLNVLEKAKILKKLGVYGKNLKPAGDLVAETPT